jgi:AcrR family transcriptional regulator
MLIKDYSKGRCVIIPKSTKQTIIDAFIAQLNKKPLYMITVQGIVKSCGINRNTFYYHFKDIYSVLDAIFEIDEQKRCEIENNFEGLADIFRRRARFATDNRKAISNLFNVLNRVKCEKYLYSGVDSLVTAYVRKQADGMSVPENTIKQASMLCRYVIVGLITEWVNGGMKGDLEFYIDNVISFLRGIIWNMLTEEPEEKNGFR